MNKKILSIIFLIVVLLCVAVTYSYLSELTSDDQFNGPSESITNDNIAEEIDQSFLEEDEEIEIGEMI